VAQVVNEIASGAAAVVLSSQAARCRSAAQRQTFPVFSGKRVKRGLYQAASGKRLNADVNGAYNILRKVLPNAFGNVGKGIAGAALQPVRLPVRTKRVA